MEVGCNFRASLCFLHVLLMQNVSDDDRLLILPSVLDQCLIMLLYDVFTDSKAG